MSSKAPATSSTAPSISVVMPVYNRASVVGDAIRSVLTQEFADFELIVVDDGSTDGTADSVAKFDDPRLRLLRLPANAGGNAARNRGIEATKAPLIAFLDSDDAYLPNKLGFTVRAFAERPEMDVLLDSFVKRYPERERPDSELRNPVLGDNDEILEALFNRRIWKATPGITAKREAVLRAGKFDEELRRRQDFDFILRLAKVGRMATTDQLLWIKSYATGTISADLRNFVPSTLAFYRRHPEYYSNPAYRPGLAHDLGRHIARLIKRRQFADAWRDAMVLAQELGWWRFNKLTIAGIGLFRARRRSIRGED